jgi:NO-binding membrane sensor protein with MHYT domain
MMETHYDWSLVAASVLVAIFASYTALDLSSGVAHSKGRARAIWLASGATAMGVGIWSMHFVGMLSFSIPGVVMGYDIELMALSVLIAIAASCLALYVVSYRQITTPTFVISGLTMGFAIAGMHYTGMASMRMPARISWNYWLVLLSYLIAAAASLSALKISFRLRDELQPKRRRVQIAGGVLMGVAISGMHYTGMAAATFVHVDRAVSTSSAVLATSTLTATVIATTMLILGMALAGSIVERALARRTEIAERNKRLYEQAEYAVTALREERDLREHFVSSLTHDLRTPLTAAKLNAQALDKRLKQLELGERKYLLNIYENINRADGMIHDLLDAQRISANRPLPIQPELLDLTELTRKALQELELVHGNRFTLNCPAAIRGCWDGGYVRRIIENLCNNAIKYGDPIAPITITLSEVGDIARIRVHNFGEPIEAEDQRNLFRLFHRSRLAQKNGSSGWGIGLTLVKGATEAHGGSVRVESTLEEGTAFIVSLPKFLERVSLGTHTGTGGRNETGL